MPKTPNGASSSSAGSCNPPPPPPAKLREDTRKWLDEFAKRLRK